MAKPALQPITGRPLRDIDGGYLYHIPGINRYVHDRFAHYELVSRRLRARYSRECHSGREGYHKVEPFRTLDNMAAGKYLLHYESGTEQA